MSEMPGQVSISGPVIGQIAVGNYINQFQNVSGCNITIYPPELRPKLERHSGPRAARPRPPRLFLDRATEIQHLEKSIQAAEPVTLCGMAGIGKTTLLEQIAHLIKPQQFPDGMFYFSALHLELEDVLQSLFSAFYESSIPFKPDRAQIELALQQLKALILIDALDLEHEDIQVILDIAPGCMFVIASKLQILHAEAETLSLRGLPADASQALFMTELGRTLSDTEKQLVCEIGMLLKGHPGNICWLAATVREDSLALDKVLEKLKAEPLESFFQDSVQSLPELQRKILAVLTAVDGQIVPQEHLAAILPSEPIQQALDQLVARTLVQSHSPAYNLSESFSSTLARSWNLAQWEELVTQYFVNWLSHQPARQLIEQIRDALWILMRKAAQRKAWKAVASLGRALEPIFFLHGYWRAWNQILLLLLEAARGLGNRALEGWALHQLGSRALCLGAKEQAMKFLSQAAGIRRSIGDQAGLQMTEHNLSLLTAVVPVGKAATPAAGTSSLMSLLIGIATIVVIGAGIITTILLYTPRAPALSQPPDGYQQESDRCPAFEWQSVLAGSTYQIQVDDQQDFSSPVYDQTVSVTSITPEILLKQGRYYWHVRAISRLNRAGKWSESRQFTISIPPAPPDLASPAWDAVEDKTAAPSFSWNVAENAVEYEFQVDNNEDFSSPEFASRTAETGLTLIDPLKQGVYSWHVRAFNVFGSPSTWSETWKFAVSIQPTTLTLLEPPDKAKLESTARPEFKWSSVENAANYQIQVDDNRDFSSPQFDARLPDTVFTAPEALAQGLYYWQVRAYNVYDTPGEWSKSAEFIISIQPLPPTLVSPKNGFTEENTTTPAFAWQGVENAASYEIQVDDNQGFDSLSFGKSTVDTIIAPADPLAQGMYYWRVRAINVFGTTSNWSETWALTISIPPISPILVVPANEDVIVSTTAPTFIWQGVPNAEEYRIQVDNNSSFDSTEYDTAASSTTWTPGAGFVQGVYYWQVQALNKYKTPGPWSPAWKFTISIRPDNPYLISPKNGTLVTVSQPTFKWTEVANTAYYELQVDDSSAFTSPEYDRTTPSIAHTAEIALPQGSYYWQVRAFNTYNTSGDWSPSEQFTVSIPPDPPTLLEPNNRSLLRNNIVTFKWKAARNASTYLLWVDDNSSFTSPIVSTTNPGTSVAISKGLPQGKYYWKVMAYNHYGTPADYWSQRWEFTISNLEAVTLDAPDNGTELKYYKWSDVNPIFSWHKAVNASGYQIQIDNNENFSSPEIDTSTSFTNIKISRGLVPNKDLCGYYDYSYYWRVRAYDQYGIYGPWSSIWKVVITVDFLC